jgi:hypothetical protein
MGVNKISVNGEYFKIILPYMRHGPIDTNFDPPLFSLDSTFNKANVKLRKTMKII